MEIKIYLDIFFLVNLVFDGILLGITGFLLRQPLKIRRMLPAAMLGAFYALGVFFLPAARLLTLLGKLIVGSIMVFLAFRPGCFRAFIKTLSVFYAVTFIYGGLAFAFSCQSGSVNLFGSAYQNSSLYIPIPMSILLLLSCLAWALLKTAFSIGAAISARGKEIVALEVLYQGKTISLRGFYDSGNLLRKDPEGEGIMICGWNAVKPLFGSVKTLDDFLRTETKITQVPYYTVSGSSSLPCFSPDAVYIKKGRYAYKTEAIWIGITNQSPDYYNNWDAILPHDFKGVENYENKLDSDIREIFRLEEKTSQLALKKRHPRPVYRR